MTSGTLRRAGLLIGLLALSACGATYRNHGYIPPAEDLAAIEVGRDTRDTVASSIGRPGVAGIADDSGWYYVRSRWREFAWRAPQEVDRRVLAVSFAPSGAVSNLEEFGLERGRVVRLSRRVTTENNRGVGFLRQAFGNLGRINPADFLDDN